VSAAITGTLATLITPDREGATAQVQGTVTAVDARSAPSGRPWAIVTLDDGETTAPVLFFCPAWAELDPAGITPGTRLAVTGKVIVRDGEAYLFGKAAGS
jgi:hypothetical protein